MHSWSGEAVFRAWTRWLCQECCCSLRSNFFPWAKVRNVFQSELRRDCQRPLITGDFPSSSSTPTAHLDSGLAAFLFKIQEFHYFRHNEALLKVCVDLPGSLWSLSSFLSQGGKREDKWIVLAKMDYSMQATRCLMRAIVLRASFKGVFRRGYSCLSADFWIAFHSAVPRQGSLVTDKDPALLSMSSGAHSAALLISVRAISPHCGLLLTVALMTATGSRLEAALTTC